VWDTHTGELLYELEHENRVRTIAYPYDNSGMLATGGNEGKLRIWDLQEAAQTSGSANGATATSTNGEGHTINTNANSTGNTGNGNGIDANKEAALVTPIKVKPHMAFEIGTGAHTEKDGIKFIVWPKDQTTLITAAAGNTLRWFDIPSRNVVKAVSLDGEIKSCELVALAPKYSNAATDIGEGQPVMAVAAGKTASFWGGVRCDKLIKKMTFPRPIASVSVDLKGRKVFVGEDDPNTWVRVYSWDDESEIGMPCYLMPYHFCSLFLNFS
jgi:serine-threonine kinase receptor-associated protein